MLNKAMALSASLLSRSALGNCAKASAMALFAYLDKILS
jgi:hypothetical protein